MTVGHLYVCSTVFNIHVDGWELKLGMFQCAHYRGQGGCLLGKFWMADHEIECCVAGI